TSRRQRPGRRGARPGAADPGLRDRGAPGGRRGRPPPALHPAGGSRMTGPVQEQIDHNCDLRARTYHAHQHRSDPAHVDQRLWGGIWAEVLPEPPADVLDLGTGSGHAAFVMAGRGHRVTGLDASTEMLRVAKERARSAKGAVPTFVHGDAVAPDLAEGGFDAVTSRYLMWTLRDPVAALRRWRRLLRPRGVLALVDATWF